VNIILIRGLGNTWTSIVSSFNIYLNHLTTNQTKLNSSKRLSKSKKVNLPILMNRPKISN